MNVFILTDLEGISGVTSIDYMERGSDEYRLACKYLTESLNYVGELCKQNGADKIYYLDGHGGGGNIYEENVFGFIEKCDIAKWQQLLQNGEIDCQIELGNHARAGTVGGFLDHTLTSRQWFSYVINGKEYSELSMHALLLAQYNVPVVLVIGDDIACAQAKEYIPDIYTAPIKTSVRRNFCHDKENAKELIAEGVKNALAGYKNLSLIKETFPLDIELTFYRTDMCEEALEHCGDEVTRLSARTIKKTLSSLKRYEELKF